MRKNILIIFLLAVFISGVSVTWSALGAETVSGNEAKAVSSEKKKSGNPLGNFFKSLGRLFGGGKKKNTTPRQETAAAPSQDKSGDVAVESAKAAKPEPSEVKVERMSKKDAKKFETKHVTRTVTASATPPSTDEKGGATEHFARGRDMLIGGDFYGASDELAAAVALDPANSEAHNLLGVALDRRGWHERAIESFEHALKLAPADEQIMNNLGYSYYLKADYSSALKYLKRAAKLAPGDDRVLNNLAVALNHAGKNKEALENFVRAGGEYTGRLNMAALLERTGRDAAAVEYYEAARRLRPDSTVLLERLTALYAQLGRTADAQQARRTLELVKTKPVVAAVGVSGK